MAGVYRRVAGADGLILAPDVVRWQILVDMLHPPAVDRALQALPDLASRRAILREKLLGAPAAGVSAIDAIVRRSLDGRTISRAATIALGSTLIGMRRAGESRALDALRTEAARAGLAAVVALLGEAPAHRALARRGRLREVCISERAPLRRWSLEAERGMSPSWLTRSRYQCLSDDGFAAHPSPVLIGRLLREPWLRVRDVLPVAARRPTTPALAFELAGHDRWIQRIEVREAMAQNPFTPTGIVLSLLPSIRQRLLVHLRCAGQCNAHPLVSAAAGELLALRG
jgi:hypothetical protein